MRTLSGLTQSILAGNAIRVYVIARLYLVSGVWGVSDAPEDFTWNSLSYRGFDVAFQVELAPTTAAAKAQAASLHLSATDPDVLSSFFVETYRAQLCDISVLIFDPETLAPSEEILFTRGRLDQASIEEGSQVLAEPDKPAVSTLTCTVTPLSADMERLNGRTRSDADQRLHRDTNDGFFKDVGVAGKSAINWGHTGPGSPASVISGTALALPGGGKGGSYPSLRPF